MRITSMHAAILAAGALALSARAEPAQVEGSVQAMSGRLSGAVRVQNGKLLVGSRELRLEDTLYLKLETPDATEAETNALRTVAGEYWRVNFVGLSNQAVIVRSGTLGQREVELASIQALEFAPEKTTRDMDQAGTMYRNKGIPLPGSLLWIKDHDVTVQSLIGVLPLPRSSLVCYVLKRPVAGTPVALDELCLTDGSIYRGRLGVDGDQITMDHAVAGVIKAGPQQVRYFMRNSPRIQWLSALGGRFEPGAAPVGKPAAPESFAYRPGVVAAPCMQALRVQPESTLRYPVPAAGGGRIFQATIAPRPSNAGDVQLRVRVDAKAVLERTLVPSSKPEAVTVRLPAGKELEIAAVGGDRMAFPADVDLCDPIVKAE